ncbi:MAG: hypothetical protein Q8R08_03740 [bacterium]|nr:hypothetical protein [bacterium]
MIWPLLVRSFVIIIIIGVVYSLWKTTKSYGGLIGSGLKWIGLGIVFFSLESLDRVLGDLSFINPISPANTESVHNIVLVFGLLFSGIGFSRLIKITKQK